MLLERATAELNDKEVDAGWLQVEIITASAGYDGPPGESKYSNRSVNISVPALYL
jgi:hypothetical protein